MRKRARDLTEGERAAKREYDRRRYLEHGDRIRAHNTANKRRNATYGRGSDSLSVVVDRDGFVWEPAQILNAIRRWSRTHHDVPPRQVDFYGKGNGANPLRGDKRPPYPSLKTVQKYFGTWSAAVREAGLEPQPKGWEAATRISHERARAKRFCKRGHPLPEWTGQPRVCRPCKALIKRASRARLAS